MIKVLHIITRLDKGGSAENTLISCRRVDRRKFQTVLVYGKSLDRYEKENFAVYYVQNLVREISPINDCLAFGKLLKIIFLEKPQIVHTHSSKAGFLGRWAAFFYNLFKPKKSKAKIVHTPHGHIFYGYYGKLPTFFFRLLEIMTSFITDKLIALTEGEKNESLKFGVGRKNQWCVIHSGLDFNYGENDRTRIRNIYSIPKEAILIVCVARLEKVKGVKYLLMALSRIAHKNVYLLIVGDGRERKKLKNLVEKLSLKNVIFVGQQKNVYSFIETGDIYVQPSLNEGMGKTVVMAASCAKPVVASNVSGIPDIIKNNVSGILVPPANPEKLAEALNILISSPDLRKLYGENARKYVTEKVNGYLRFSSERMVKLLENLYEEIISAC